MKKAALFAVSVGAGNLSKAEFPETIKFDFSACGGELSEAAPIGKSRAVLSKTVGEISADEIAEIRRTIAKKCNADFRKSYEYGGDGRWKIKMLGTNAGSEAVEGRKYTSWILEKPNGDLLWFDAGEGCSQTAFLMGLNTYRTKAVFVSHPHADHIAGLAGFFHSFRTMKRICKIKTTAVVKVFVSTPESARAGLALSTLGGKPHGIEISELCGDGEIWNDGEVSVEALGNLHMKPKSNGAKVSFSFRIKLLGKHKKTIVFSGDIRSLDELAPFLNGGCDLLMMENGHHYPDAICRALRKNYPDKVREIMFMHLGRQSVRNGAFEKALAEKYWERPVVFARDRLVVEI